VIGRPACLTASSMISAPVSEYFAARATAYQGQIPIASQIRA